MAYDGERERAIMGALRDGRLTFGECEGWRERWSADSAAARRELGELPGRPAVAAANVATIDRGVADLRAERMGASASGAGASASAAAGGRVRMSEGGAMVYATADGEFPVSMTAAGEPAVFTDSGWMAVAAFEASGVPASALVEAQDLVATIPDGPTAASFRQGPA